MMLTSLIIDDEALTRTLLRHGLTRAGYKVIEAENGHAALTRLQTTSPDFIILDVLMPGMNGFETAQLIRTLPDNADTPIIFLSSRADTEAAKKGLESGGQCYLNKPFKMSELLANIEMLLPIC